jgi:hypothetical protein
MADQTHLSKQKPALCLDVSEKAIDRLRSSGALAWINVSSLVRISLASLRAYEQRLPEPACLSPEGRRPLGVRHAPLLKGAAHSDRYSRAGPSGPWFLPRGMQRGWWRSTRS